VGPHPDRHTGEVTFSLQVRDKAGQVASPGTPSPCTPAAGTFNMVCSVPKGLAGRLRRSRHGTGAPLRTRAPATACPPPSRAPPLELRLPPSNLGQLLLAMCRARGPPL